MEMASRRSSCPGLFVQFDLTKMASYASSVCFLLKTIFVLKISKNLFYTMNKLHNVLRPFVTAEKCLRVSKTEPD